MEEVKAVSFAELRECISTGKRLTQVFRLNVLDPEKTSAVIRPLVSEQSLIETMKDTNSIIVTDIKGVVYAGRDPDMPANMARYARPTDARTLPTPQAFAALRAASALATLCSPGTFRSTSTTSPVSRAFTWNPIPADDRTGADARRWACAEFRL